MERFETRITRELIASHHREAKLQQQILKLMAGSGAVDAELAAEWRGQEIATQRLMKVMEGGAA